MEKRVKTTTEQYKSNQIHNLLAKLTTVGAFIESGNLTSITEVFGTKGVALIVKRLIDLTEVAE